MRTKHRLILVEGLPASGKSTAAKFIADALHFTNVDEGTGDHPADWENHALIDEECFRQIMDMLEEDDDRRDLASCADVYPQGIAVPLEKWYPDAVRERLMQYKIYDVLPWAQERDIMLEKWRIFAENAGSKGNVFNCVFLQNPMCETMMRFDLDISESAAYIGEIAQIIAPLKPFAVYLQTDDIAGRIEHVRAERGEEWMNAVIRYHCNGAYGRANGLSGFDGYIAALRERQRRELIILEQLGLPHIVVNEPQRGWPAAYEQMLAAIGNS